MRSPTYEQALNNQGVPWSYEEKVPIEGIDLAKGLRNQARLENPLDEEVVSFFADRMTAGDKFPPAILWRPGSGRYIPVDGNHGLAARVKCRFKLTDAYILGTKDAQVADRIAWTFNNLVNGRRNTEEEGLQHAMDFVRKYGWAVDTAAKEWGIKGWKLRDRLKVAEVGDAIDRHKVKRTPSLTDPKLLSLAPLMSVGEDVMARAAEVVATSGVSEKDVDTLVKDVRRAKTHDEKLKAVDEFAQSEKVTVSKAASKNGTIQTRNDPRRRLQSVLGELERLFEEYPNKALKPAISEDVKRCRDMASGVVDRLVSLFGLGAIPRTEAS